MRQSLNERLGISLMQYEIFCQNVTLPDVFFSFSTPVGRPGDLTPRVDRTECPGPGNNRENVVKRKIKKN